MTSLVLATSWMSMTPLMVVRVMTGSILLTRHQPQLTLMGASASSGEPPISTKLQGQAQAPVPATQAHLR